MLLTLITLLFCSVQARQCLYGTVCGSISKGISFALPIAGRLLFNRVCNNSYYSSLGNACIEACYRCFVAPHKYFNGKVCYG